MAMLIFHNVLLNIWPPFSDQILVLSSYEVVSKYAMAIPRFLHGMPVQSSSQSGHLIQQN
jgi:hypothetical protein